MVVDIDLKDLFNWYTQEDKTMEFKDRLMVRGAGLLWIPLFITFWVFLVIIILKGNVYKQFSPLSIILTSTLLLVFGIIFSIIEINRIKILRKYNKYTKTRFEEHYKAMENDYENLVQKEAQSLFKFLDGAAAIITQTNVDYSEIKTRIQDLRNSMSIFREKYFHKNEEE